MKQQHLFFILPFVVLGLAACGDDDETSTPTTGGIALTVSDSCAGAVLEGADVAGTSIADGVTGGDGVFSLEGLEPGEYALVANASGYLPEEATLTVTAGETATGAVDLTCQSLAVGGVARDYLAGLSEADAYSPVIASGAIFDNFMDGDATNDPVAISVRSADHYALGHMPTAINIPWKSVASEASLALLGEPNPDARFVDYCYTGHTGGIAAGVLNLLGYPTANMKYGFASWTEDATALTAYAVYPEQDKDFTIETTVNTTTDTYEVPRIAFDEATDAWETTRLAADAYLNDADMKPTMSAQALFDNLNDGDATNDPFIISVRSATHYALGHIPGAINIPWKEIALEENLAKIPTDREIVAYCYTGHTGAIATSVLGTLGYHKVKNLKYGFMGWTQDATARVSAAFDSTTDGHDFAIVTGTEPGVF